MRIIAGDYKGRRLYSPKDNEIRPTTDKVKEAIFSILTNQIYGSRVIDLFAGTGNLGLEALSRGAEHCYFGDHSRESLSLIKENIAYCRASDKSTVIAGDYKRVLGRISEPCDVILLDPPYRSGVLPRCLELIGEQGLLAEGGVIVCEHRKEEKLDDVLGGFAKVKERRYGTVVVSIYMS